MFMPNLSSFFTPLGSGSGKKSRIRILGLKISRILTDPDPDPKHWLIFNTFFKTEIKRG